MESTITATSTLRKKTVGMSKTSPKSRCLVEVKDFLRSYTQCSLNNCLGILDVVYFNQLHMYSGYYDVVMYQPANVSDDQSNYR